MGFVKERAAGRSAAKLLSKDAARRIAANIACRGTVTAFAQ
jgi:hypothetical protein